MPLLHPVTLDQSVIGERLPWDLYTANGVLVARAGVRVLNAAHFAELATRPLFRRHLDLNQESEENRDPSAELRRLMQALPDALKKSGAPDFEYGLRRHVRTLMRFSQRNHDALLGLARLLPIGDPAVRHCLLVAVVAIHLGRQMAMPDRSIESLACAALTMNLGALRLHADLADGREAFDDYARAGIQDHPEHGARLLEASGVRDPDWLATVRQHHENIDGSGYPLGLRGEEIGQSARLLRVVDYFVAKISGRRSRPPKSARFALRLILLEGDRERLDTRFAQHLLHRYGLYPVGTLVRLENMEIAVVTRNSGRCGNASVATSFMRQRGRFLAFPIERDISPSGLAVTDVLERDAYRSRFPWELFWRDWS